MMKNRVFLKVLSTMLFAAVITSCFASMIDSANANPLQGGGTKTPNPSLGGGLDLGSGVNGDNSGSNNYLII
jgi:hypothetical protein